MKPRNRLIVLASGGTGGHVFPAEALAAALLQRGFAVAFFTDRRGGRYGETLARVPQRHIRAGQYMGRGLLARLATVAKMAWGTVQAWWHLWRMRPAAAVGFGGYASVPTMVASGLLDVPSVIHEPNAVVGRANRLAAPKATAIATAFKTVYGLPESTTATPVRTGNPVRPEISALTKAPYAAPSKSGAFKILVVGGSQGATIFSRVMPAAVEALPQALRQRLDITQQCREEDIAEARGGYELAGLRPELATFIEDIPARLKRCHLVICRAGASTVAEVTAAGRPAILVPYPHATDDHQTANAQALADAGAGWLIAEPEFTSERLAERLGAFLAEPDLLAKAAAAARKFGLPDATERFAQLVVDTAKARLEAAA